MFLQSPDLKKNSVNNNAMVPTTTIAIDVDGRCENMFALTEDLELITRFCMPVCTRDMQTRELALDVIEKTVEGWLDGYGSPKHSRLSSISSSNNLEGVLNTTNGHADNSIVSVGGGIKSVSKEYLSLVTLHLPALLCLSVNCPFPDVREKCVHILRLVEERGLPVPQATIRGPSAYIPQDELPSLGTFNEQVR
ncbi:uncharacterized protein [Anabrus simplex]|uniref:uncharacterized protein n=1 Tax=Anabrus simplex TaxID=316456 RepID=UPI0035A32E97